MTPRACLLRIGFGLLLLGLHASPAASSQEMVHAFVRIKASSCEQFDDTIGALEDRGAVMRHRFYPVAAIGTIPEGSAASLSGLSGVLRVRVGPLSEAEMARMEEHERWLAGAYNNIFFSPPAVPRSSALPGVEPVPIDTGPRTIPEECLEEIKRARASAPGAPPPFPEATSEFMLGHIAVAAILPESEPGYGSHDWSPEEEEKATEEIISAMDWWARHSPNQELRFSYEINYAVPVQTEPMEDGQDQAEEIWASQSLASLGYTQGNRFQRSYDCVNDMRSRYHADWGFIVFVLHGYPGQQFSGGFLAYAYLGGPFNVNVYSNGYLGPEDLDRVIAHESGHIFYTLDEYPSAPVSCSSRSGYLNVENANKQQGDASCKNDVPCIMREGSQPTPFEILDPCYYTEGQVGWWDSDADGVPDILDVAPVIESAMLFPNGSAGGASVDTVRGEKAIIRGTVAAGTFPNRNPRSMHNGVAFTVEPVAAEYRVDGGEWLRCRPADGRFDDPTEGFSAVVQYVDPGVVHTVELRAITAHGNTTPEEDRRTFNVVFVYTPPPVHILSSNPTSPPVSVVFSPFDAPGTGGTAPVKVEVYDVTGRRIKVLASGEREVGKVYETSWDGTGPDGGRVPAGVYFVTMRSAGRASSQKVILIP